MVIQSLVEFEGCGVWSYFAKGTHDASEFAGEMKRQWDTEVDPGDVLYCYARFCPVGPDYDPPSTVVLMLGQKPGRGAFPITYIEVI